MFKNNWCAFVIHIPVSYYILSASFDAIHLEFYEKKHLEHIQFVQQPFSVYLFFPNFAFSSLEHWNQTKQFGLHMCILHKEKRA